MTDKKINIKTFQRVEKIREIIKKGYAELEKISDKLMKEHGECVFETELNEADENGKKWMRLTITDNVKKLEEDGVVYSAASFRRFDVAVKRLKNKPKS